ncbi:hypothetical protein LSCM1_05061 [Leishmania martiniquensis]|uniref:Uncharacterized protein n=1 Tax=Leishmania martiniquensis TaxID=1580590 RepID=A0A836HJD4_9TRYP|nr:hypothetical protein LSCM1_05061 [Leishmania martiniquensis]
MAEGPVPTTLTAVLGGLMTNTTSAPTHSSTDSPFPSTSPVPAGGWTIDSAIFWLVTIFYFAVSSAALAYFVSRWRRRVYGSDRVLRGGAGADAGGAGANAIAVSEGLLATIGAMIERATSTTALAGAAAWQRSENTRHRSASQGPGTRHRGGGATGGSGRGLGWLGGLAPFLPGAQARSPAPKRSKQKSDDGHVDCDALPTVWNEGAGAGGAGHGGVLGGSAVPSSSIGSTMTARDQQQQQRGEN